MGLAERGKVSQGRGCAWGGVVEPGKGDAVRICVFVVWAENFLIDCQRPLVERLS